MQILETTLKQPGDAIFELVGAMLGNGYIYYKPPHHRIEISGNATEDRPYLNYLAEIFRKFNDKGIHLYEKHHEKGKSIRLTIYSKVSVMYFINQIGLIHEGKKAEIAEIPDRLLEAGWNKTKLILRGFADTDGCLFFAQKGTYRNHSYPMIEIRSASEKLLTQFQHILQEHGFSPRIRTVKSRYASKAAYLYLSGESQLSKWMEEIGFSNPKHFTKYLVWKNKGYCPPGTTLKERLEILDEPGLLSG